MPFYSSTLSSSESTVRGYYSSVTTSPESATPSAVLISGTDAGSSSDTGTITTSNIFVFMDGVSVGGSSDQGKLTNAREVPPVRGLAPSYRQKDILNPHFHLPLTFTGINGGALVNEQDTGRDIVDCVKAIVGFTIGVRQDMPNFGIPEVVFRQHRELIINQVRQALAEWEDRAVMDIGAELDLNDDMIWNILIEAGVSVHG